MAFSHNCILVLIAAFMSSRDPRSQTLRPDSKSRTTWASSWTAIDSIVDREQAARQLRQRKASLRMNAFKWCADGGEFLELIVDRAAILSKMGNAVMRENDDAPSPTQTKSAARMSA
jgi:hypothetical protein